MKLRRVNLKYLLDTILKDNNLNYSLKDDKLLISYLVTKLCHLHYIASNRVGSSSANINLANFNSTIQNSANSASGITISSSDKFDFWEKLKDDIYKIVVNSSDGSLYFKQISKGVWVDPLGNNWQYNPLEPIVDPKAGLITVTGSIRQIDRVKSYINSLSNQVKKEV